MSLNPSSGIVGTVVTAELTGATPGTELTVIFKIPGDPVLATGTVDANGNATFTFTIPWTPGGTYTIFFTDFLCACQIGVPFEVTVARQTPVPTSTPTTPPTATSTATPQVPVTNTPTAIAATPTATPRVPVLGTTDTFGGGGPNVGILGLGFLAIVTVLAWFAATRRDGGAALAMAGAPMPDAGPDAYSTELDMATLDGLRRSDNPSVRAESSRSRLAAGAGFVAGAVLFFRRK